MQEFIKRAVEYTRDNLLCTNSEKMKRFARVDCEAPIQVNRDKLNSQSCGEPQCCGDTNVLIIIADVLIEARPIVNTVIDKMQ